jgi:hypothetical protein
MLAFHDDFAVKSKYVGRVLQHREADEIIHGKYWEDGRGCAVGCSVHSGDHALYEIELGIPIMLARLEDRIFEGMSNGRSKDFPLQFLSSIKIGADLSLVGWKFLHWLLTEELVGRDNPKVAPTIKRCADVLVPLTKGEPPDKKEALAATRAAYAAACAADAANAAANAAGAAANAANAANAAAYAAANAAGAAANAAHAAAGAAAYAAAGAAADAAAYAADAATRAAYAAAYAAADAGRKQCYERMADKLLALMWECPGREPVVAMGIAV